jgi:hypothetical protein
VVKTINVRFFPKTGYLPTVLSWQAMRYFGRLFQYAGLVLPLLAIVLQLQEAISLGNMLAMLVAAVCAFWIGRILEGYAPR